MTKTDAISLPIQSPAVSRRGVFSLAGAAGALAVSPAGARGFGHGFTHSVASGEPGARRVLLWTRYVGERDTTLDWQVAADVDFNTIISGGQVTASATNDFCAKAVAEGLTPDRWYFYRFIAPDGAMSPTGRTRTLPEGPTGNFRMAVFSCSNFGFGYFNAYAHAAQANDCDLAVHLGDYIYEYGSDTYPSPGQRHPDRIALPGSEIVALADYRLRHATYRADPDLQRLHQVLPMIALWDDHESANDSWMDGAQNHQPATEGDWTTRKAIAKRVYREWMPVSDEPYAAYDIGDLATLFRLDTRLEGREKQFDFSAILAGQTDAPAMMAALEAFSDGDYADPDRQLLGDVQERWLIDALKASRRRGTQWQVLAQQVLIGKLASPPGLVDEVQDTLPDFARRRLQAAGMARRAELPLNMDAWDGYPAARRRLFEGALDADANLVVLAGDTHNAWAFDLGHEGERVGVEFGTSSVTSPGFESYLAAIAPDRLARLVVDANPELQWADTSQRGYMAVELTPDRATSEYRFVAGIRNRSTQLAGTYRITTEAGSNALSQ